MQTIDKKIDCVGSRRTRRYWKKGRRKKNLGTSVLNKKGWKDHLRWSRVAAVVFGTSLFY